MASGERLTGLDGVTVAFGDGPPALRAITLLVAPGEVLAVVGPSGSGKTTLLRAVAGLEPVRAGRVLVAGRDVTSVATPERDVAMVFQSTSLVPFLDVANNLARAVQARGATKPEADRRVSERGRRLGLSRILPRLPRTLSLGENALAGIGRAMVRSPRAFLFDEPLAHLDPAERGRARRTLVDLVRQTGVAAVYVTHEQAEAMAVGDRLAVLRDGELVQLDRPQRIYHRPVDVFVAGFVGDPEISLLPAEVVATAGGAGFRVGERTLPLWGPLPAGLEARAAVLVGLRAEDVAETGPGADPASVALRVLVRSVELIGPFAIVTTDVEARGGAAGIRLVARVDAETRLRPGDRAELQVDARRAHVFDARTGRALLHPPELAAGDRPAPRPPD